MTSAALRQIDTRRSIASQHSADARHDALGENATLNCDLRQETWWRTRLIAQLHAAVQLFDQMFTI